MNRNTLYQEYTSLLKEMDETKKGIEGLENRLGKVNRSLIEYSTTLDNTKPGITGLLTRVYWDSIRQKRNVIKQRIITSNALQESLDESIRNEEETIRSLQKKIGTIALSYLWHIDIYPGTQQDYSKDISATIAAIPLHSQVKGISFVLRHNGSGLKKDVKVLGESPEYLLSQQATAIVDSMQTFREIIEHKKGHEIIDVYFGRPVRIIR